MQNTLYERFLFLVAYFLMVIFVVVVLGVGGVLALIALTVAVVSWYPIMFIEWANNKVKRKD